MRPQLTVAQDAQCSRCGKSETPAEDGPIRAESMAIGATADTPRVADRRHRLSAAGGDGVRRLSADSGRTPGLVHDDALQAAIRRPASPAKCVDANHRQTDAKAYRADSSAIYRRLLTA